MLLRAAVRMTASAGRAHVRSRAKLALRAPSRFSSFGSTQKPYSVLSFNRSLHGTSPLLASSESHGSPDKTFAMVYTCGVCETRNAKAFSQLAYTKGVVLAKCEGCKNWHLVADNLGWFTDMGGNVNLSEIARMQGQELGDVLSLKPDELEMVTKAISDRTDAKSGDSKDGNSS